jgi:alpha-ribazole phosphatase
MALTLLRHLPPQVTPGTCYGRTDLALAPGWEPRAAALAAEVSTGSRIFTSPLKRCRQIAEKMGQFEISPDLVEMDFGAWEMQPWDAIDRAEMDAWAADFFDARPHGGESVAMLRDRVARALGTIPDGSVIVTHHGVIKAAAALTGHAEGWNITVDFGARLVVDKPVGD